jgi:RNA polymerase sigma-70 factor (ECF subfamily)
METSDSDIDLLKRARGGESGALTELFSRYRERLRRMVGLRMNNRLRSRVDPSDIVQDACVEATRVLDRYLDDPAMPFYLWLRHLTGEKLIQAHRHHLGAQMRAADREISLARGAGPEANSESIAAFLVGRMSSPSRAAMRGETKQKLHDALNSMQPMDREVLVLRHFEHLSGPETAEVLGISHDAVKKRYVRALERLGSLLDSLMT